MGEFMEDANVSALYYKGGKLPQDATPTPQETPSQTIPTQDYNYLGDDLKNLGYFECALLVVLCWMLSIWLLWHRHNKIILLSQGTALQVVLFGIFLSSISLFTLTIDDSPYSMISTQMGWDMACMASPILYVVGFQIALGTILYKNIRLLRIFKNQSLQRKNSVGKQTALILAGIGSIELLIILIWVGVAPMVWVREDLYVQNNILQSYGYCASSQDSSGFLGIVCVFHFIVLASVVYYTNQVRLLPSSYHEATYLALACAALVQLFIICVAVAYEVRKSPSGRFIVTSSLVFFSNFTILLALFMPKIIRIHLGFELLGYHGNNNNNNNNKKGNNNAVPPPPPPQAGGFTPPNLSHHPPPPPTSLPPPPPPPPPLQLNVANGLPILRTPRYRAVPVPPQQQQQQPSNAGNMVSSGDRATSSDGAESAIVGGPPPHRHSAPPHLPVRVGGGGVNNNNNGKPPLKSVLDLKVSIRTEDIPRLSMEEEDDVSR